MAKSDEIYKRGDIILSTQNGLSYKVLAVFQNTLWLRDFKTNKVIKGFQKKDAYI